MKSFLLSFINNIELIAAVCGGIIALFQWRESNNNRRAEYLDSLLHKLWENKDIQNFILLNDYDEDWYNEAFHRADDKTKSTLADKTLSFMNYICYVVQVKIIHKKERALFDYYLSALALCKDMRQYLFDLYQYSILNKKPFLFNYFLKVSIDEGLIPKAFKNKNYYKYIMIKENAINKKISYKIPNEIVLLEQEFTSEKLFLKTCSRCKHCKNFNQGICKAMKNIEEYYWLPLNQKSRCDKFDFDEKKWQY